MEFTNVFHTLHTKLVIKEYQKHLVLKDHSFLHKYVQTQMRFLDISSLGSIYQYVFKIKHKLKKRNKWEFGSENASQQKMRKVKPSPQTKGPRNDNQLLENLSKSQIVKGSGKTRKDIRKWFKFHKIPQHNTNERCTKKLLVAKLKASELDPNTNSNSKLEKGKHIIGVEPSTTITTTQNQLDDLEELEEGELLFHSQMWVKGDLLHFIIYNGIQNNLISKFFKWLQFLITPHSQPYNILWIRQG